MLTIGNLFKSPARRAMDQARARGRALAKARTALRRERRAILKRQARAEELHTDAVAHERAGQPALARQKVRRFVQAGHEVSARTMALDNMEHVLEQATSKDNYDEFLRAMRVVANIEELARDAVDPDEIRERLSALAERNQDLMEPWLEQAGASVPAAIVSPQLNPEEEEAYAHVMTEAAAAIAAGDPRRDGSEFARMDAELERKMDAALNRG